MNAVMVYMGAAIAEIGGCFAFWMWLRLSRSSWWGLAGLISLAIFAVILTRSEAAFAGRTYAAYGGIYIGASLVWLWVVEGVSPDRWDVAGAGICLVGAALILWGPRAA